MRDFAEIDWEISAVPAMPPAGTTGKRSIARLAFSFPGTLAVALIVLTVLTVRSRFNDPDLWWHLKTGEIIWSNRAIPRTDLLSFTTGQNSWVPSEWLSQLSLYAAWRAGGYSGLMLWF